MRAAAKRGKHDVGRMLAAAEQLDDQIGIVGERLVEKGWR